MHPVTRQTSSLVINVTNKENKSLPVNFIEILFEKILTVFTILESLNYSFLFNEYRPLPLSISRTGVTSSILLELNVQVTNFTECLILVDERLKNLHILRIKIDQMGSSSFKMDDQVWLLEKCFLELICSLFPRIN